QNIRHTPENGLALITAELRLVVRRHLKGAAHVLDRGLRHCAGDFVAVRVTYLDAPRVVDMFAGDAHGFMAYATGIDVFCQIVTHLESPLYPGSGDVVERHVEDVEVAQSPGFRNVSDT